MQPSGGSVYGGLGDRRDQGSLARRLGRHADELVRVDRSPLCAAIMRGASANAAEGGTVADLFAGVDLPPGSVPSLRLVGALHHLVLSGAVPDLARFYPSAGGGESPEGVWPVALDALRANEEWVRGRLRLGVQTNEPGRAAVLYAALLWLTERHPGPVRLLEIGASAGLNLLADRFAYEVEGETLGDPGSPVRFSEPWSPTPGVELAACAARLEIVAREGCDLAPLDPRSADDRLTLLSYIWPDESVRLTRTRAALELAARDPVPVEAAPAEEWLPEALSRRAEDELTVVWQSVVRQYLPRAALEGIERAFRVAGARPGGLVWLRMERGEDEPGGMGLTMIDRTEGEERLLARCDDHGPPVAWEAFS